MAPQMHQIALRIEPQALKYGRRIKWDGSTLILTDRSARPVNQLQVVTQRKSDGVLVWVNALFDQGHEGKPLRLFVAIVRFMPRFSQLPDTLLYGGEVGIFRCFCHSGPNGVEIHLAHAGEYRRFVQQCLSLEAPFPESPRTAILFVGLPGKVLIEAAHEPGDVAQPLAPDSYRLLGLGRFGLRGGLASLVTGDKQR
jgi:hypothetical protein